MATSTPPWYKGERKITIHSTICKILSMASVFTSLFCECTACKISNHNTNDWNLRKIILCWKHSNLKNWIELIVTFTSIQIRITRSGKSAPNSKRTESTPLFDRKQKATSLEIAKISFIKMPRCKIHLPISEDTFSIAHLEVKIFLYGSNLTTSHLKVFLCVKIGLFLALN